MNRFAAALLLLCMVIAPALASSWQVIEPAPKSKTGFPVTTGGMLLRYSVATKTTPVTVTIDGPTILRAKVRVQAFTTLRQFKVLASLDNGSPAEFVEEALPSTNMEGPNGLKMSAVRDLDFKIPEGKHTLSLTSGDTTALYFRVFKRVLESGEPAQWEAITPRGFKELVGVVVREKESTYFRQTSARPLELKLNGPTQVRVLSRAETMGGEEGKIVKWRLEVKVDGQSVGVYPCEQAVSSVAGHSTQSEFVMTAAQTVQFNLPLGKHNVTIHLLDTDASVVNRILIPAKALTNTGK